MDCVYVVFGRDDYCDVGNWGVNEMDEAKPIGVFANRGAAMECFRNSVRSAWFNIKESGLYSDDDPLFESTEEDLFADWNTDKDEYEYDEMEICWVYRESEESAEWRIFTPNPETEVVIMPSIRVERMKVGEAD